MSTSGTATRIHVTTMAGGISKSAEFAKKGLAEFAVNVGTRCGHGCTYCSTGTVLRNHPSFKYAGESPFALGYSIVDPATPDRVAQDAERMRRRGVIQLCTTVDAWAPEAQAHDLGRRCLEAVLAQPGWTVRVLTKNTAVMGDYGLIRKHRDRVKVALSITAPGRCTDIIKVVEPSASPVNDRIAALRQARSRGLRTYAMLCPLLPRISDTPGAVDELIELAADIEAEEIFCEPVNARGPGLRLTQEALMAGGFVPEAEAVAATRTKRGWSTYATSLVKSVQAACRKRHLIGRLRFLLYPAGLLPEHARAIADDPEGIVWLGKTLD